MAFVGVPSDRMPPISKQLFDVGKQTIFAPVIDDCIAREWSFSKKDFKKEQTRLYQLGIDFDVEPLRQRVKNVTIQRAQQAA